MEATFWIQERQWWNKGVADRGSSKCRYLVFKQHDCSVSNSVDEFEPDSKIIWRLFILQFERVVWLPTYGLRIWGFLCTRQSYKQKIQQNYEKNTSFKNTLYSVCVCVLYDLMDHAGASLRAVQFSSKCFDYQRKQVPTENIKGTSGLISLFCFFFLDPYEDQFEKRDQAKKERVAKNEYQRLRNIARIRKIPSEWRVLFCFLYNQRCV